MQQFAKNSEVLEHARIHKLMVLEQGKPLSFAAVIRYWQTAPVFNTFFNQVLAETPFAAFFWELPPITRATAGRPFECVMTNSPQLATVSADAGTFAAYFSAPASGSAVTSFPNPGHDAWLIAPIPQAPVHVYPHLAAFVRRGPPAQQQAFWRHVGMAVSERLSQRPLWLSTSGLGVYWLHVRLDSRPKYYTWQPYKSQGDQQDNI